MQVGIFQAHSAGQTLSSRLNRLDETLKGESLDLIVCPELYLSGYNIGDEMHAQAKYADGEYAQAIGRLAAKHQCAIVYGYPERTQAGDLFNSAACINKQGECIANHRKLMIPPGFEQSLFSTGSNLTLFDLAGFKCALLICYDSEYPEAVRAAAQAGAQVLIVPTALSANWGSVATQMMPTRAFENGVWLLYANHAGEENGLSYFGGSCIVAPDGHDAARANVQEALIVTEINQAQVIAAQERLPYLQSVKTLIPKLFG